MTEEQMSSPSRHSPFRSPRRVACRLTRIVVLGVALLLFSDTTFAQHGHGGHGTAPVERPVREIEEGTWLEQWLESAETLHRVASLKEAGRDSFRATVRYVLYEDAAASSDDDDEQQAGPREREFWRGTLIGRFHSRQIQLAADNSKTYYVDGDDRWIVVHGDKHGDMPQPPDEPKGEQGHDECQSTEKNEAPGESTDEDSATEEESAATPPYMPFQLDEPRTTLTTLWHFITMPFRFRDPESWKSPAGRMVYGDQRHYLARLRYDSTTEGAVNHWYTVGLGHHDEHVSIVAYYADLDDRGIHPHRAQLHAIVIDEVATVGGLVLPARWTIHHWSRVDGIVSQPLGYVEVTDHELISIDEDAFCPIPDAAIRRGVENPAQNAENEEEKDRADEDDPSNVTAANS